MSSFFLYDVASLACQKLLKSANVSRSYLKNESSTYFLRHGVVGAKWCRQRDW